MRALVETLPDSDETPWTASRSGGVPDFAHSSVLTQHRGVWTKRIRSPRAPAREI